jgi:hypothetical protein
MPTVEEPTISLTEYTWSVIDDPFAIGPAPLPTPNCRGCHAGRRGYDVGPLSTARVIVEV